MQPNLQRAENLIRGKAFDSAIKRAKLTHEENKALPMDKDSVMLQPSDQWDDIDKGKRGKIVSTPSRRFMVNWDEIDWRR